MSEELADPGAQAERTALAWQRTGLAALMVGALLLHASPARHTLTPWPGVLLMTAGGLCSAVVAPWRYRRVVRAVRAERTPLSTAVMAVSAVLVVLVALGAAVTLLVP